MPNPNGPEDHETSRSRRALRAVRSHVQPGSFPLLLFAAVLLYVLNGLAIDSMAGAILAQVARIGVLCASIYVLSAHRLTLWLGTLGAGRHRGSALPRGRDGGARRAGRRSARLPSRPSPLAAAPRRVAFATVRLRQHVTKGAGSCEEAPPDGWR